MKMKKAAAGAAILLFICIFAVFAWSITNENALYDDNSQTTLIVEDDNVAGQTERIKGRNGGLFAEIIGASSGTAWLPITSGGRNIGTTGAATATTVSFSATSSFFIVSNYSTQTLHVGLFGTAATATGGVQVLPRGSFPLFGVSTKELSIYNTGAISASWSIDTGDRP